MVPSYLPQTLYIPLYALLHLHRPLHPCICLHLPPRLRQTTAIVDASFLASAWRLCPVLETPRSVQERAYIGEWKRNMREPPPPPPPPPRTINIALVIYNGIVLAVLLGGSGDGWIDSPGPQSCLISPGKGLGFKQKHGLGSFRNLPYVCSPLSCSTPGIEAQAPQQRFIWVAVEGVV